MHQIDNEDTAKQIFGTAPFMTIMHACTQPINCVSTHTIINRSSTFGVCLLTRTPDDTMSVMYCTTSTDEKTHIVD